MSDIESSEEITQKRFDNILIKFLLNEPFFSSIVRSMRKVRTREIPTAGVTFVDDSITLYWNPDFVGSLPTKKVFGLLKHECYHLIFKHLTTRKKDPHLLWNIATDLAINSSISFDELPDGGLYPGRLSDTVKNNHLPKELQEKSRQFSQFIADLPPNKASEWYMEKLQNDENIKQIIKDLYQRNSGKTSNGSGQPGESDDGDTSDEFSGTSPGFDHHFDKPLSEGEKHVADARVKKIVKEAAERADRSNSWGSASGEMRSKIRAAFQNTVDWKQVLRYFCGTKQRANKTRTMRKINRKYPYIHSGKKIKHTSNLAIYIDQSGSVGNSELVLFFAALSELSKTIKFTVFHFDCTVDVSSKYVWKKGQGHRTPYRTRGGGTCFDSVEDHFRKISGEYDGYLVMTDGMAPKPKSCISKRCWVLLPSYKKLYFTPDKRDTVVNMNNFGNDMST